jgi:hypothetical protein
MTFGVLSVAVLAGCTEPGIRVTRDDFGEKWPIVLDGGTLRCQIDGPRKLVTLDTGDGIQYGINGAARGFGFPDIKAKLKPGKELADLQPLIDRGLTLCR